MERRFYIELDTEFTYRDGEEMYHIFEYGRWNEFGEPYCVMPYLTYEEAHALVTKWNNGGEVPNVNA